jgi:hypothetical protein
VVARDHLHVDAGRATGAHRGERGLARRVDECREAEQPEAVELRSVPLSDREDAHAALGERIDDLDRPVRGHASLQHDLRRTFHVDGAALVHRGHELALGVERDRVEPRRARALRARVDAGALRRLEQRELGRACAVAA